MTILILPLRTIWLFPKETEAADRHATAVLFLHSNLYFNCYSGAGCSKVLILKGIERNDDIKYVPIFI
jgi:hypothetical protein